MEAVGTIVNVVQKIVKAAETARQNRKRCLDLADRARTVGDILRDDIAGRMAGGGGVTMPPLERLKAALDDALELVESQRRFGLGIITSGRTAARFQDVETRITACVVDLGLAEQIAARRRDHPAPLEEPRPQQGKDVHSLLQGYLAQSAQPPPPSLYNKYLELEQQQQQMLLQTYLPQCAGKDAQSLVHGYLAQSAQQGTPESVVHGYLAQYLQQGMDAQSLVQGYLAQSASPPPQQSKDVRSLLKGYGYIPM